MEDQKNNQQTSRDEGIGRTFNRGPQQNEGDKSGSNKEDISSMDQQEGMMEHGETGGSGHLAPKQDDKDQKQ